MTDLATMNADDLVSLFHDDPTRAGVVVDAESRRHSKFGLGLVAQRQ